ncbi:MAG: adenosylcobinamide-GDP ribazoletransferase, partial [Anaerolineales bacterium]
MDNIPKTKRLSVWNAFWAALQFLTISPAVVKQPFTAPEMGASIIFYPLVGLIIGLILALGSWLLQNIFPIQLTA